MWYCVLSGTVSGTECGTVFVNITNTVIIPRTCEQMPTGLGFYGLKNNFLETSEWQTDVGECTTVFQNPVFTFSSHDRLLLFVFNT